MSDWSQERVDAKNAAFWNELCGSELARRLGITDFSKDSLRKFDDWYMDYYPYLKRHVALPLMAGKDVLEIGLGYGTVSQKIGEAGANYRGLDIAENPVALVNHRLRENNLCGEAIQGNMLNCPFEDERFDWLIAIGCFHHTGNLQRCLDESWRVLRPGGTAMVMVYNSYSYRRWRLFYEDTRRYFLWDKFGIGQDPGNASAVERASYDDSREGEAAPETVFASGAHMKRMTRRWRNKRIYRENIAAYEWIIKNQERSTACKWFGPLCGLDLYCHLTK